MRKSVAAFVFALIPLPSLEAPARAECRAAGPGDSTYVGTAGALPPTPRSTPAQNDRRSGFVGLLDPNRDTYDPGKPSYGARYGENYGGPGSTNEQASTFLGTPCGPSMTVTPPDPPVTLTLPTPPVIATSPGAVDAYGIPVRPGNIIPPNPIPSLPPPQTLQVAPWNPADTHNTLRP
jgi:hypothetical protein